VQRVPARDRALVEAFLRVPNFAFHGDALDKVTSPTTTAV